jgi:hypothetical protein
MQPGSSGWHGSSSTVPPRAVTAAAGVAPPPEAAGLARPLLAIDERVAARPSEPSAEPPEGVLVDIPIAGVDDVSVPVPLVESVVPIAAADVDDVAPSVESVAVVADPIVVSEVRAGRVAAAVEPIPNLAAKELKSVGAPKPRVASKASNSGSGAVGTMTAVSGGSVNVLVPGAVVVIVPVPAPPGAAAEANGEVCASATQGVAISATGAIQPTILFTPPPCTHWTWTSRSTIAARA